MPHPNCLSEFRTLWLPHVTDAGLDRLVRLLESASPLLIHGAFTNAVPMGCLATHVAWNHPCTAHLHDDAGVRWLTRVAGLNPATSAVILAWDKAGVADWELRTALLAECRAELEKRAEKTDLTPSRKDEKTETGSEPALSSSRLCGLA